MVSNLKVKNLVLFSKQLEDLEYKKHNSLLHSNGSDD